MLELSVGKGRQVTPTAVVQYYATVATERVRYVQSSVLPSEVLLHTGAVEQMGNGWGLTLFTQSFKLLLETMNISLQPTPTVHIQ